jgi:hypothetical protein
VNDPHTESETERLNFLIGRLAWAVYANGLAVPRIRRMVKYGHELKQQALYADNTGKAIADSVPNLDKIVENLDRLNIVSASGYLAFVCFLMQLKYTRNNNKMFTNDKTCLIFEGRGRSGKSETAKAMCELERRYGLVVSVASAAELTETHTERVFKSHFAYCDEIHPAELKRTSVLQLVNGGEKELNPKGRDMYEHEVNTNVVMTTNESMTAQQRRISIIKFGYPKNGRPLERGTLVKIVENVMNSLPDFDEHYFDIYEKVKDANANRINPGAVEAILSLLYQAGLLGQKSMRFTLNDVYQHIKKTGRFKLLVPGERRTAVDIVISDFVARGILRVSKCEDYGETLIYEIDRRDYLKLVEEYNALNTPKEKIIKITAAEIRELLAPYYPTQGGGSGSKPPVLLLPPPSESDTVDLSWADELLGIPTVPAQPAFDGMDWANNDAVPFHDRVAAEDSPEWNIAVANSDGYLAKPSYNMDGASWLLWQKSKRRKAEKLERQKKAAAKKGMTLDEYVAWCATCQPADEEKVLADFKERQRAKAEKADKEWQQELANRKWASEH